MIQDLRSAVMWRSKFLLLGGPPYHPWSGGPIMPLYVSRPNSAFGRARIRNPAFGVQQQQTKTATAQFPVFARYATLAVEADDNWPLQVW